MYIYIYMHIIQIFAEQQQNFSKYSNSMHKKYHVNKCYEMVHFAHRLGGSQSAVYFSFSSTTRADRETTSCHKTLRDVLYEHEEMNCENTYISILIFRSRGASENNLREAVTKSDVLYDDVMKARPLWHTYFIRNEPLELPKHH